MNNWQDYNLGFEARNRQCAHLKIKYVMRQMNELAWLVSLLSCGKEHKYLHVSLSAKASDISKDGQASSPHSSLPQNCCRHCVVLLILSKNHFQNLSQIFIKPSTFVLKGWNFPYHGCPLTTCYLEALEVLSGRVLILVTGNSEGHFLWHLVKCEP